MNLLSIIAGGVKLLNMLIAMAERRQLIDQGRSEYAQDQTRRLLNVVQEARRLRANLTSAERKRLREKYRYRD